MYSRKIKITIALISLLYISNCSGFKPIYMDNHYSINKLKFFTITTDNKKTSQNIKKVLTSLLPAKKEIKYIIKIEAKSETSGSVSDSTRKISRYRNVVSANVKLYYREKEYDKLIYVFKEKKSTPYSLVLNNIRSTLASKNKAEQTSVKLLTEEIYKRILIYLANN